MSNLTGTTMTPSERRFAEYIQSLSPADRGVVEKAIEIIPLYRAVAVEADQRPEVGDSDAADTRLVALFREWMAAERSSATLQSQDDSPERAEFEAACDRASDILDEIADTPANGLTGFVIKAYMHFHCERGGAFDNPCAIRAFQESEEGYTVTQLGRSLIEDMIRFVPELPPLAVVGAIGSAAVITEEERENRLGIVCRECAELLKEIRTPTDADYRDVVAQVAAAILPGSKARQPVPRARPSPPKSSASASPSRGRKLTVTWGVGRPFAPLIASIAPPQGADE
jgi:hypothetical protein